MFCTTLRRRPSTSGIVPILTSAPPGGLDLRERDLRTHDLSILISSMNSSTPASNLLVLLLTPTAMSQSNLSATLSRIHHFASLTGTANAAIFFLLSPRPSEPKASAPTSANAPATSLSPLKAYTTLAHILLFGTPPGAVEGEATAAAATVLLQEPSTSHNHPPPPSQPINQTSVELPSPLSIPLIPFSNPSDLPALLTSYTTGLASASTHTFSTTAVTATAVLTPQARPGRRALSALELLPWCSTQAPLGREAVIALSDGFVGLRDLVDGVLRVEVEECEEPDDGRECAMGGDAGERWRRMEEVLGKEVADGVRDFWREEWVAE